MLLYAGVGFLVPIAFTAIYSYLVHRTDLLKDDGPAEYMRSARRRALLSIVAYPVTAALVFASPTLSLVIFFNYHKGMKIGPIPRNDVASYLVAEAVAPKNLRTYPAVTI